MFARPRNHIIDLIAELFNDGAHAKLAGVIGRRGRSLFRECPAQTGVL